MKALICGATGFIGRHLTRRLLEAHQVRALARNATSESASELAAWGVEVVEGDVLDRSSIARAAEGQEVIYNLVGIDESVLARNDRAGDLMWRVNALGTWHVLEEARLAGARRCVVVSSVLTFGHAVDGEPIDEERRFNLTRYHSPYVFSRLQQEFYALQAAARGLEVLIINPAFVFGPGDVRPNLPGALLLARLRGRIPVTPPGGVSCISVDDVADGLIAALERGQSGERYIFGNENLTFQELFTLIAETPGAPPAPKRTISKRTLGGVARTADTVLSLVGRGGSIPGYAGVQLIGDGMYYRSDKAVAELGLPQTPVAPAILAAAEDFLARGLWQRRSA